MSGDTTFDPDYLLEQYETLRREVLALVPGTQRGHGLMLFLTRGMVAWMHALSSLASRSFPSQLPTDTCMPILSSRPDIARVLANMLLGCMQETHE